VRDAKDWISEHEVLPTEEVVAALRARDREAKLEALREAYDRCCKVTFTVNALNVINDMIAALERGGGEKEQGT